MTSGINCRAMGSEVATMGPDIEELHGAVAIELSPFPNRQLQQLDANLRVAFKCGGLTFQGRLARQAFLRGEHLTSSHMCTFIRCVGHRLRP